jgi:hypothetical protein
MTTPDDPREMAIDDLLRCGCAAEQNDSRQEAVLAQTLGVIRRRRRLKRLGVALSLAVCYLAGIVTPVSWFLNRSDRSYGQIAINDKQDQSTASSWTWQNPSTVSSFNWGENPPKNGQSSRAATQFGEDAGADALAASPRPDNSTDSGVKKMSRYEWMRREGDRLLRVSGDIAQAVRRYNRALTLATDQELAIAPDEDSWLLMALKTEHTKETNNDRSPIN